MVAWAKQLQRRWKEGVLPARGDRQKWKQEEEEAARETVLGFLGGGWYGFLGWGTPEGDPTLLGGNHSLWLQRIPQPASRGQRILWMP